MSTEFLCSNAYKMLSLDEPLELEGTSRLHGARMARLADIDGWDTVFQGILEY